MIYPIEKLCLSNFDWTLKPEVVNYLNFHYELWSKAGSMPGYQVEDPQDYLKSFNWIENWFNAYFIGKFSDYLLVSLTIILTLFVVFYDKVKNTKKNIKFLDHKFLKIYISLIIISLIWFFNFPSLRYAGYVIIFLILIFPFSAYMGKLTNISSKKKY